MCFIKDDFISVNLTGRYLKCSLVTMSSFTDVYYITGMYASYEKIFAHVDYSIFYIQNLIFCPFFFSPRYLFTSHCPSLGCSLLEVLMLFKLNSGQPSLRTAGPCCEPEWPGPEVA